jgi:hypothetical protein
MRKLPFVYPAAIARVALIGNLCTRHNAVRLWSLGRQ